MKARLSSDTTAFPNGTGMASAVAVALYGHLRTQEMTTRVPVGEPEPTHKNDTPQTREKCTGITVVYQVLYAVLVLVEYCTSRTEF